VLVLLIALLLGMGLFFGRPDLVQQYAPGLLPHAVPTQGALPVQRLATFALEVSAPVGADTAALRSRFLEEFAKRAQSTYGAGALVNTGSFAYSGGEPHEARSERGGVVYQAICQAFVTVAVR